MSTHTSHSLNELEIALDMAAAQMRRLFDENIQLQSKLVDARSELAEAHARMRAAGHKLRVVADRLPQAVLADSAEVAQEKAA